MDHWDELEKMQVSCPLVPEVRLVLAGRGGWGWGKFIRDWLGPEQIHQRLGCASLSRKKASEGYSNSLGG